MVIDDGRTIKCRLMIASQYAMYFYLDSHVSMYSRVFSGEAFRRQKNTNAWEMETVRSYLVVVVHVVLVVTTGVFLLACLKKVSAL